MRRYVYLILSLMLMAVAVAEDRAAVIANKQGADIDAPAISLQISLGAWGPRWKHMGFKGEQQNEFGASVSSLSGAIKGTKATMHARVRAEKTDERSLRFEYAIGADQDAQLTMAMVAIDPGKRWAGNRESSICESGRKKQYPGRSVKLVWAKGSNTFNFSRRSMRLTIQFNKAVTVLSDGALRVVLADQLKANEDVLLSFDVSYSMPIDFYPSVEDAPDVAGKRILVSMGT